jgi:NAD(P)-dependent dehydrogenase (short-subunit alcohol dehydrogenase family)
MAETSRRPELAEPAFWSWLGFWVQFLVLGLFVVIGAFAASECRGPGDYVSGVLLIIGALALAFLRLKHRFDGGAAGWRDVLFVEAMAKHQEKSKAEIEKEFFEHVRPSSLLKRFATVDEVAAMVTYMASELSSATNGAALRVDGGVVRAIL